MTTKVCSKCKLEKGALEFNHNKRHKDGLSAWCKSCTTEYNKDYFKKNRDVLIEAHKEFYIDHREEIKDYYTVRNITSDVRFSHRTSHLKKYGLSGEEYDEILIKQEGKCAICGRHQSELTRRLFIDHNHDTGKVRALLCYYCNTILSCAHDDIAILETTIKYLQLYK